MHPFGLVETPFNRNCSHVISDGNLDPYFLQQYYNGNSQRITPHINICKVQSKTQEVAFVLRQGTVPALLVAIVSQERKKPPDMMEPSASTTAAPAAVPAPAAPAPAAGGESAAGSATSPAADMLRQFSTQFQTKMSQVQVPTAIKERTDELERRISATDIARINGYMRLVNLVFAGGLWVTCFIRMFQVPSYSHFLVIIYIMYVGSFLYCQYLIIPHKRLISNRWRFVCWLQVPECGTRLR